MIIQAKFSEIPRALSQGHLGPPSSNQPSLNHSRSEICLERQQCGQERFTGQQPHFVGGFYNTILQQTISKDNPHDNRQIQDFKYPNRAANNKEHIPTNPPPPYAECSGSGNNSTASTSANKEAKMSDTHPAMEMANMAAARAGKSGSEGSERGVCSGPSGKNVSRHFSTGISDQYSQKLASQS